MKSWVSMARLKNKQNVELPQFSEEADQEFSFWLLNQIPLNYLVADKHALPAEAIRHFYLDQRWMGYMVQGAYSIGRSCSQDYARERKYSDIKKDKTLTGIFFRSRIVKNWSNLQIDLLDKEKKTVSVLYKRKIGEDIILAIAQEKFKFVSISIPQEDVYFSLEREGSDYVKHLVSVTEESAGKILDEEIKIPFRESEDSRVIDVKKLTETMKQRLNKREESQGMFSSMEYAVQMLDKAQRAVFSVLWEESV